MAASPPRRSPQHQQHRSSNVLRRLSRTRAAATEPLPKLHQFTRPMMRRRACLHADETGGELAEEVEHLLSAQLPNENDLAVRIDAVHLEDVLGQIDADGANLHVDDPLR